MRIGIIVAMCAVLAACAPTTQRPGIDPVKAEAEKRLQQEMAYKEMVDQNARVQRILFKIAGASADLCPKTAWRTGLSIATTETIAREYRSIAQANTWVNEAPTIIGIVPGSPGETAGAQIGDIVGSVGGAAVPNGKAGLEVIAKALEDSNGSPLKVAVRRGAMPSELEITPTKQCGYGAAVNDRPEINAFADGTKIVVTKGMMRFAQSDDELALVLGHETAHNSRGHVDAMRGNRLAGAVVGAVFQVLLRVPNAGQLGADAAGSAYSQEFEAEADYVGLYMMARAGYPIDDAAKFWRRMAVENPKGISAASTHPTTPDRFVGIDTAVAEIKAKIAAGEPLVPNEMPKQAANQPTQVEFRQ